MNKQPSLKKILTTDFAAFVGLLFPIITWSMYIIFRVTKFFSATDWTFPAISLAITIVSVCVVIWRVRVFNTIFNDGIEVPATISSLFFFRDRGRVEYIYTYQDQKYSSSNAVMKVKQTRALQAGDQVIVMIDRNNPKRAYIRDLYM